MPIFDFKCPKCETIEEHFCKFDAVIKCKCGEEMKKQFSTPHVYHSFREGYFENIDINPLYISSKKQLRHECEKRGVSSHYLD